MMASFQQQLQEMVSNTTELKNSSQWFGSEVESMIRKKTFNKIFKETSQPEIGKMYLYIYDPKTKATLPFYDMFPLTIATNMYSDGFLGLNLHYLPPGARAGLLNALSIVASNDKYNESTKLNISYDILKSASTRFSGFEQCVKRYLYGYVKSPLRLIEAEDWVKVVQLPLQKWQVNPNKKYAATPPY